MMKRLTAVLFAVAMIPAAAAAQGLPALLVPADCRSLSLGATGTESSYDMEAGSVLDVRGIFGKWAPSAVDGTLAGGSAKFSVGNSLILHAECVDFIDREYGITGEDGAIRGQFKPYDLMFSAGAAYRIVQPLTVRMKLRFISSAIAPDVSATALCADISAMYEREAWSAWAAVRNIGSGPDYGGGRWSLPSLAAVGGSIKPIRALTATAELGYMFNGAVTAGLGAEYGIADLVFVRAGYHYGQAEKALPSFVSAGVGVKISCIRLDAALLPAIGPIAGSFLLSAGVSF